MPKEEAYIQSSFNASPARVKLTPDGIVEEYSVSPPPFVRSQTITLNIPKTMDTFDQITQNFYGANGYKKNIPIHILPIKPPIDSGITKPIIKPNILPVKPPINPVVPVGPIGPVGPVNPEGGSGSGIQPVDNNKGDAGQKTGFVDGLTEHGISYAVATIAGGGIGYLVGKKYEKGIIGAVLGVGTFFGATWLYFNKDSK